MSASSLKHPFAERTVFGMGFRVSVCGNVVTKPDGTPQGTNPNTSGYLGFTVDLPTGRRIIPVHRLQAFQKFGNQIYEPGIEVRHKDGNHRNNADSNILIGSHSDNMMDRPAEVRSRLAGNASRKHDAQAVRAFYSATRSYKKTMAEFGISSKGTLNYILRPFDREEQAA